MPYFDKNGRKKVLLISTNWSKKKKKRCLSPGSSLPWTEWPLPARGDWFTFVFIYGCNKKPGHRHEPEMQFTKSIVCYRLYYVFLKFYMPFKNTEDKTNAILPVKLITMDARSRAC